MKNYTKILFFTLSFFPTPTLFGAASFKAQEKALQAQQALVPKSKKECRLAVVTKARDYYVASQNVNFLNLARNMMSFDGNAEDLLMKCFDEAVRFAKEEKKKKIKDIEAMECLEAIMMDLLYNPEFFYLERKRSI